MAFTPIPEYEGKAPYVFITYAQQDEKIAYSIAVKMYNEGFRLWSSAACGNPSNMRIAERLGNAEVAMVFLSRSYLKYASYKEFEPRAVMNSPKKKIVICLDDTPLGTDWNTVDFPAGIRYNPDIPQELWLRINSSDTLERCRGAWPKTPMPLPFEESRAINVSVNEDELSDELTSLNSVMASFGAGLDDSEIKNITLFNPDNSRTSRFRWPEKQERTQEQEYYAIENLIDNSPPPATAEKKQYDSMIGLIESFMEKSNRAKEEELQRLLSEPKEESQRANALPENPYGYRPIPKNEFDHVDLTQDVSTDPVMITHSTELNAGLKPIVIDYGDDTEFASYSMTRSSARTGRGANVTYYPGDDVSGQEEPSLPVEPPAPIVAEEPSDKKKDSAEITAQSFEKIVDDRKLITSTEDNMSDARLTYHLGALDAFDENDYRDEEPPKPAPAEDVSTRFKNEEIPLPTLRFDKPVLPPADPPEMPSRKERRRCIVSVRTRIRRTEYESEMYEVNGRWIPGEIYHRLMPNAKYTMVRRISRPRQTVQPAAAPAPMYRAPRPDLNVNSRLHSAVNTFFAPPPLRQTSAEGIPDSVRSALRERHEMRRNEAIRRLEAEAAEQQASRTNFKPTTAAPEEDNTPARKHRFSHEGGIKKSLMANMETPVDTENAEESHRQYGARAELAASGENKSSSKEPEKPSKKDKNKEEERAAKKAAQKAAEKAARKEAQKKAAQKKAEEEKKNKKKKQAKSDKPTEKSAVRSLQLSTRARSVFPDADDDSLIEMPGKNLPKLNYDPEAYRDMNLSEILFGEDGDKKGGKKKKKK